MGTITDKLNKLAETKSAIKTAIVNKGVSISDTDTFASYADKIASISGGGTPTEGIYGVFIYDTNGNLTKPEEWDTANNDLAVGVAVIDENCSFVIGKEEDKRAFDLNYGKLDWEGIINSKKYSDYAGEANSSIVRGLTPGEDNAFNWAYSNTITVNGTTLYGYLGALGEWWTAYNNKSSINSALSKIGGTAMNTKDYHWTSTQGSSDDAWMLGWDNGYVSNNYKNYNYYVRAFYHLDYPNIHYSVKLYDGTIISNRREECAELEDDSHIFIGKQSSLKINNKSINISDSSVPLIEGLHPNFTPALPNGKLTINAPNITSIRTIIGSNIKSYSGDLTIELIAPKLQTIDYLFNYIAPNNFIFDTMSNITSLSQMYYSCNNIVYLPKLDTSNVKSISQMLCCNRVIKISEISLKSYNASSSISHSTFFNSSPITNLRFFLIKDLGTGSKINSVNFSAFYNYGIEDESIPLSAGARQSLIDTLITYSYDRATAGYSACTVKLHANTKALLTQDEIAQITAKGYTIA